MTEASKASRSFSKGHGRVNGLDIGAILLFICGLFLSLSMINFITGLLNDGNPIWSFFGVAVLLSIGFITIVWGMRKIHKQGYIFEPHIVYNTVNMKYVDLRRHPRQTVFNESNNSLYVATKNSVILFYDTINDIVDEIAIKDPKYMAVDHFKDRLFVTLERGIAVIDTSSNILIKNIFEEFRFGQLCINFNTNMLYAINLDFYCVYIIECSSHTLIDKIYCDSHPYAATVDPNTNSIYIANSDHIVIVIDGSKNKVMSTIHLPNLSRRMSDCTVGLDGLYVDPSNKILYIKEEVIGPPNQGGVGLQTLFFKIDLNAIHCPEYFIHDFECDILPKTERYMPDRRSESILRKHDIFWRDRSLNDSFIVNSVRSTILDRYRWKKT